jgi:hypothetical protein
MSVRRIVGSTVLLSIGVAGCNGAHQRTPQPPVKVHGVLRMTGGPSGVTGPGAPGRVSFVGPGRPGSRLDTPTKSDGTFDVALIPGTYQVTGHSPLYNGDEGVCRTQDDVVVASRSNDVVIVACEPR